MNAGDPQFEWRGVDGNPVEPPRVIANAKGVRDVPTDRRTEIIGAFLAEGLPVEPH